MQASINRVIAGKRYNTETATVIASDEYWDGHNHERHGRNTHLYRTPKGAYFVVHSSQWERERTAMMVLSQTEAIELYEQLPRHDVDFEDAFPGVEVEDA